MNCNTIYVSNVINGDDSITLVPNRAIKTLENRGCYRLVICCNATAESNLPVNIQVNGVNIPVLCKAGNLVYANMLEKRKNYSIMYGNENQPTYVNGQFVIQNCLCPRASEVPSTTTTSDDSTEVNPDMRKK